MTASLGRIARHLVGGNWKDQGTWESLESLSGIEKPTSEAIEAARATVEAEMVAEAAAFAVAGTYHVLPEDFRLATAEKDQSAFTSLLTLLREAQAPPPAEITIFDYLGAPVVISLERFWEIMVAYGMAIYAAKAGQ